MKDSEKYPTVGDKIGALSDILYVHAKRAAEDPDLVGLRDKGVKW